MSGGIPIPARAPSPFASLRLPAYRAILSARFRMLLQYRGAALGGLITQFFFGLIITMVYEAFYASTTKPQPMSIEQVRSYIWLGQALLQMLPWNQEVELRAMIRTGSVAFELLRPVDLYSLWYTRSVAARTAPTILRAAPMFAAALLLGWLSPPASGLSFLCWIAAQAGALFLSCAITTLLTLTLLWTVSGEGVTQLVCALVVILSGMNVPLPLMPEAFQPILSFLPFRGLIDTPFRVYLGLIPPSSFPPALLHQAVWIAALIVLGRVVMARGLKKLSVQGG